MVEEFAERKGKSCAREKKYCREQSFQEDELYYHDAELHRQNIQQCVSLIIISLPNFSARLHRVSMER